MSEGFTLKRDPLPKKITYEWLIDNDACPDAETFKELFPDGTEMTDDALDKLIEEDVDVDFIVGAAYSMYEGKMKDRLHEKTKHAWENYDETSALLHDLLRKANKEFSRARVKALTDIIETENIPTLDGEQYKLDFGRS